MWFLLPVGTQHPLSLAKIGSQIRANGHKAFVLRCSVVGSRLHEGERGRVGCCSGACLNDGVFCGKEPIESSAQAPIQTLNESRSRDKFFNPRNDDTGGKGVANRCSGTVNLERGNDRCMLDSSDLPCGVFFGNKPIDSLSPWLRANGA